MKNFRIILALTLIALFGCSTRVRAVDAGDAGSQEASTQAAEPTEPMESPEQTIDPWPGFVIPEGGIRYGSYEPERLLPVSPVQGDIAQYNGTHWVNLTPGTAGTVLTSNGPSANLSWATTSTGFPAGPVQGDILYYNGTAWVNLVPGTSGQVLQTNGASANPSWATPASGFPSSPAQGDLVYYNGTAWVNLAPGTAGQVLETNGASANPSWLSTSGLGFPASPVQGDIVYYNGTAWVNLAPGTSGQVLTTNGASANPSWNTSSGLPGSPVQGDIPYYNGTVWANLAPGVSGQFLQTNGSGANPSWNNVLGGTMGGGTVSSNLTTDVTVAADPTFTNLGNSISLAGTAFLIQAQMIGLSNGAETPRLQVTVDGTAQNYLTSYGPSVSASGNGTMAVVIGTITGLSSGTHTFQLQGSYSGAGSLTVHAGTNPTRENAWLLVSPVGGANNSNTLFTSMGSPATHVASTTAETPLFTYTMPGNTLPSNGSIHVHVGGVVFNNAGGSHSQTFRVYLGSTALLTFALTNGSSGVNHAPFQFEADISNSGVTNTQYANGFMYQNFGSTFGGTASAFANVNYLDNVSSVDTTQNQTVKVTAQNDANSSNLYVDAYSNIVTLSKTAATGTSAGVCTSTSRPSAIGSGNIYLCTDQPVLYFDDPSTALWKQFATEYMPAAAPAASYTAVGNVVLNQAADVVRASSTSNAASTSGGALIASGALGSSASWSVNLVTSAALNVAANPSDSTIAVATCNGTTSGTSVCNGVYILTSNANWGIGYITSQQGGGTSTLGGTFTGGPSINYQGAVMTGSPRWHMRLLADGTNLHYQWSQDGFEYVDLASAATPSGQTDYGFLLGNFGGSTGGYAQAKIYENTLSTSLTQYTITSNTNTNPCVVTIGTNAIQPGDVVAIHGATTNLNTGTGSFALGGGWPVTAVGSTTITVATTSTPATGSAGTVTLLSR